MIAKNLKFIADVNLEKPIVEFISKEGYDIKWTPNFNPKITDEDLIKLARSEKRILLTNDKDFGELIFLQKKLSHGIILFRIKGQATQIKLDLIKKLITLYIDKLSGHFTVISRNKFRFVSMEDKK